MLFAHVEGSSPIEARIVKVSADAAVDLALLKVSLPATLPWLAPGQSPVAGGVAQDAEALVLGFPGFYQAVEEAGGGRGRRARTTRGGRVRRWRGRSCFIRQSRTGAWPPLLMLVVRQARAV